MKRNLDFLKRDYSCLRHDERVMDWVLPVCSWEKVDEIDKVDWTLGDIVFRDLRGERVLD